MAQAQLDAFNFSLKSDDFLSIECEFFEKKDNVLSGCRYILSYKTDQKRFTYFLKKRKDMLEA